MKITLFALFIALLMVGCGESQVDPIVDRIDETPKPQEPKDLFADAIDLDKLQKRGREGEEILYFPNSDTPYTGKVIGSRDPSGKPWELFNYKDGKLDGLSTGWYENGQKEYEINYKDGKVDGLATGWYENGQKKYENNWKDGDRDGLSTSWYENGQKELEHNYKDGEKDGLSTSWYENGQKEYENNWKDGKRDELSTSWHENGQKKLEHNYKDGKEDGLSTSWHENGQKEYENNWKDGKKDGRSTAWYENGQKSFEGIYKDGNPRVRVSWHTDGQLLWKEVYEDGKLVKDETTELYAKLEKEKEKAEALKARATQIQKARRGELTVPEYAVLFQRCNRDDVIAILGDPDSVYGNGRYLTWNGATYSTLRKTKEDLSVTFSKNLMAESVQIYGEQVYKITNLIFKEDIDRFFKNLNK